jgi:Xaa-Pro aminopeptidase
MLQPVGRFAGCRKKGQFNMSENVIVQRLSKLRGVMKECGVDTLLIPTADYHNSEYVAPYFQAREHYSGFTGSAGVLAVRLNEAALWADGRYFIQAAAELEGSGIALMKMGEPGVLTLHEWLKETMPEGSVLAFDGRCITKKEGDELAERLASKGITFLTEDDLAARAWEDRPAFPCTKVFLLDADKYAGETTRSKLSRLRGRMEDKGAAAYVSGKLDEIMWLYNIRANDVECNPVALSYTVVTKDHAILYIQDAEVTEELKKYAEDNGIELKSYEGFLTQLAQLPLGGENGRNIRVWIDPENSSYAMALALEKREDSRLLEASSPLEYMKAIRNETEIRNFKDIYVEDSAVLTKFIYWIKKSIREGASLTEGDAAAYLDHLREGIEDYVELSFGTISAYGPNAAMMHYEPDRNGGARIEPKGMLLVDSGGHYLRGTTDVTRTMSMGPVSEEMRESYTLTAVSQLQLMGTVFMEGCSGMTLDIMAREPMWRRGMDYKCGTGHGIGYLLNVHEGPQNIRWRARSSADTTPFAAGMVISDEPGVYKAGKYGIRIETILLCRDWGTTSDGHFLCFEPLTFAPLDRDLIDVSLLTPDTRKMLNEYHQQVVEKISPYLNEEEREWLVKECAEL